MTMPMLGFVTLTLLLTNCLCNVASSQFVEMASDEEDQENIFNQMSKSNDKFTTRFYSMVAPKVGGNTVCSPLSAHMILSILTYGARGKTAEELRSALYLLSDDSLTQNGFKSLLQSLNNATGLEISLANAIYIQEGITLMPEFLSMNSKYFDSDTPRVDFKNSVESTRQINSWVENQTNNRIKNLLSADAVDEWTKIIMINAVYFKGNWANKFNTEYTENRPFYITKDTKRHIPTMYTKSEYAYAELEELNARAIRLPYSNDDFSMLIILPNEIEGLQNLEQNFNRGSIESTYWRSGKVELFLPKFKVESTINLEEILQEMGIKQVFTDFADLSGISQAPLKVGHVLQKAFIEVNEEGSEAAAATLVQIRCRRMASPPKVFDVNRPFMFAIQHKPSKIPIFVGSIRDLQMLPTKDEL
ncbi:alaserpin-like isoform X1 [Neodiprion fabricii]|uniref:alaserpin-like isoform X1 n=2 Tax=Neodiprion fabricii TaxID=2872261 RepID=UPI001ED92FC5|nr:alaserpin-like isoform X1 [Neodiprion fabricii]